MKKTAIVFFILLSIQLFPQTQSIAFQNSFKEKCQIIADSLPTAKVTKPKPTIVRILGQALTGSAIGVLGGYTFGALGDKLLPDNHRSYFAKKIVSIMLGYSVGNAIGIYWIGNTEYIHGNFGYTLLGSLVGMAVIIASIYVDETGGLSLFLPGPCIAGIIAFYLSSETVEPVKTDALIQLQNEKIQLGIPKIFLTRIDKASNKLKYNVELFRLNF